MLHFVLFPTVRARCSFLLQNNNTSLKWSSFFEAQRVEAFSISLAVPNQLAEALACVINFAANTGQPKRLPIPRSHLLSVPPGRRGNEMRLLCSAGARGRSRGRKKSEFLAGKKTSLKRKLLRKINPQNTAYASLQESFLERFPSPARLVLLAFTKAFPGAAPQWTPLLPCAQGCLFYEHCPQSGVGIEAIYN